MFVTGPEEQETTIYGSYNLTANENIEAQTVLKSEFKLKVIDLGSVGAFVSSHYHAFVSFPSCELSPKMDVTYN